MGIGALLRVCRQRILLPWLATSIVRRGLQKLRGMQVRDVQRYRVLELPLAHAAQVLVATKLDLVDKRVVDRAALQELCEKRNIEFLEARVLAHLVDLTQDRQVQRMVPT